MISTTREKTGHASSYAKAEKMKSLTLCARGCLRTSLELTNLIYLTVMLICCILTTIVLPTKENTISLGDCSSYYGL